jgi:calpain-15
VYSILKMAERSTVTTKELNPGILLHKHISPASPTQPFECTYEFKVEIQRLNTLEFTADFTGSKNVTLENSTGLIKTTLIQPFSTQSVAILRMSKQWTLKSKFRFTIKPAPRPVQEQYIQRENEHIEALLEKANRHLAKIPISLCALNEIEQVLMSHDMHYIDIHFPPRNSTIYKELEQEPYEQLVHWRRPYDFFHFESQETCREPRIFGDSIEPYDIKQGQLNTGWFVSALATLAEKPALIERLFITKQMNSLGIYRVKLCKNGEWVTVTVDDFFPCYPMGMPIFSRTIGSELWVSILEKAYAKLHGHYYLLKGGYSAEALSDFTGCPTSRYNLQEDSVIAIAESGDLWSLMKEHEREGFLMSASTIGEDRWAEQQFFGSMPAGLKPGHSYTIIGMHDFSGHRVIHFRNPWGTLNWQGDWSAKSTLWTPHSQSELKPEFDDQDSTFFMSYEDLLAHFISLNVCRIKNWDEVRIKGKFIKISDSETPDYESVVSKWYYCFDLKDTTRVFIGVHQEDERILGVALKRSYLDVGLVVLRRELDGSLTLVHNRELSFERQIECEVILEPGSYIILPRTTGCLLRRPHDAPREKTKLLNSKGNLSDVAESAVSDVFRKFDMLLTRELAFNEFKAFHEAISKSITEVEFRQKILKKYCSTDKGITLTGFKEFFRDAIKEQGEEAIWSWMDSLGYDRDLYSVKSRTFLLTLHSDIELSVVVRDAVATELDPRTNILLIEKFGKELEYKTGVRCFFQFNKDVHAYSYGILNEQAGDIEANLDCSGSENMIFSTNTTLVKRRIEPGKMEFMLHALAHPSVDTFVRSAKCSWHSV